MTATRSRRFWRPAGPDARLMAYFESEGLRLHYVLHGAGEPARSSVVLLHGLGSCGDDWLFQLPAIRPRHTVLTLDLPGHGRSSLPRGRVSAAGLAGPVAGLIDALGLAPAHIVGLSLGGVVALQLALDPPSSVRSLVLVNSFARLRQPPAAVLRGLVRIGLLMTGAPMSWTAAWVARGLFPGRDQGPMRQAAAQRLASNSRVAYLRTITSFLPFDVRGRLSELRLPTLVVAGARDQTVPLRAKAELAQGIAGARLEVIEGSGHATPLDAAQAFNALLLRFIEEVEAE